MASKQSPELAIEELKKLLREKEELKDVAAEKVERVVAELQGQYLDISEPAVRRLITGFGDFRINKFDKNRQLFEELAKGQSPKYLVFACSDSRVSPTLILNMEPGEAFMVRNIANMVPPFDQLRYSDVGAIIEYGITALKIPNIVVIGHSRCGGIKRLMTHPEDGSRPFDFIDEWVKIGLPAKEKVKKEHPHAPCEELCAYCEKESVENSIMNLKSYPYVEREMREKKVKVFGGYYDFVRGEFKLWEYSDDFGFTDSITLPLPIAINPIEILNPPRPPLDRHQPAVTRIISGFHHFMDFHFNKCPELYEQLAQGQSPKYLVFACSDSRVSPTLILNFQPGEAFMVRNIANLVPPFNQLKYGGVGAAIEYAITALKVPNIVVIGHSRCGGINRLMTHPENGTPPFDFIDKWLTVASPAKAKVKGEHDPHTPLEKLCKFCEKESVNNSLVNLQTYPYVQREMRENRLNLLAGYYDFVNGEFTIWKHTSHITTPLTFPVTPVPLPLPIN